MVEILEFEKVDKNKYKNILAYIDKNNFGRKVSGYCVYLNGRNGILLNNDGYCKLILNRADGLDVYDFTTDLYGNIITINKDGYEIKYDEDGITYTSSNGVTVFFGLVKLEESRGDYTYKIYLEQYNPREDIRCDFEYFIADRKPNNKDIIPIYEIDVSDLEEIYIDKKSSEMQDEPFGFVGKNHLYFCKYNTYSGSFDHTLRLIRMMGIGNYIKSSELPEITESFCKAKYIRKDYQYLTGFPLCKGYSEEEIIKLVESFGFSSKVPELILNVYNGNDNIVNGIHELCEEIQKHELEEKSAKKLNFTFDKEQ